MQAKDVNANYLDMRMKSYTYFEILCRLEIYV